MERRGVPLVCKLCILALLRDNDDNIPQCVRWQQIWITIINMYSLSKEVWKLNGQMEKHSQQEAQTWRKSEGRR